MTAVSITEERDGAKIKAIVNTGQVQLKAGIISTSKLRRILRDMERTTKWAASGGPYSKGGPGGLAASIEAHGPVTIGFKTVGTVSSRKSYARSVDRGAKIHPIFPKGAPRVYRFLGDYNGPPQLKFVWHGRVVYTPHVPMAWHTRFISHPGQRGKFFLEKSATLIAVRYKMRLIVNPG